ncbi:hypothetical protein GCM10022403_081950 [Streptomyces coacervatus]|uniref:Uncharacterized protein n=1 Tax=Streptomyces coacervatus TaxID=647381 RepID=A0ABP7J7M5_9ACTN
MPIGPRCAVDRLQRHRGWLRSSPRPFGAGADFAVVVRNALVSRRAGVACAPGNAGGLLLYTALAVAGVAAVLAAVPALLRALQLLVVLEVPLTL